jgi:hypothetical protein
MVMASSFPAVPSAVAAIDEAGSTSRTTVAADGSFSLPLAKAHVYKLAVLGGNVGGNGAIPVVFPRQSGSLDRSFRLDSDGALIRLGAVRYAPKRPAAGFKALVAPAAQDCTDCVNDDQQVTCADASGSGEAQLSESETSALETETAEQADPTQEMAVVDHNAPDEVVGCDTEGDNVNQTGEH